MSNAQAPNPTPGLVRNPARLGTESLHATEYGSNLKLDRAPPRNRLPEFDHDYEHDHEQTGASFFTVALPLVILGLGIRH